MYTIISSREYKGLHQAHYSNLQISSGGYDQELILQCYSNARSISRQEFQSKIMNDFWDAKKYFLTSTFQPWNKMFNSV
jgi:hypothetical protein